MNIEESLQHRAKKSPCAPAVGRTSSRRYPMSVFAVLYCRIAYALAAGTLVSLLTGCDATNTQSTGTDRSVPAQQIEAKIGDATVYVTAIQASSIPPEVAREHGIVQRDDLVMLRVSPRRRNNDSEIVSAPVQVQASAKSFGAPLQPLPLKQVTANGLVDHVGTIEVQLPETVSFQVTVATSDGASQTLSLTGNFSKRP